MSMSSAAGGRRGPARPEESGGAWGPGGGASGPVAVRYVLNAGAARVPPRADARAAEAGQGPADDAAWERWWRQPAAADVKYVQFMGKDNVPFHTVGFPCTLMGVNETVDASGRWSVSNNAPWKLVDELKGFNWLDYYGGKFSTSQGRGVFMVPSVMEAETMAQYGVQCVGRSDELVDEFFAVSVERRITHPCVVAITDAARGQLFSD